MNELMQTHVKEALVTLGTFVALALMVSTGMVFKAFGVPDIEFLNYPFQYFWFVIGAWVSLFVGFAIYHKYVGRLETEKEALRAGADGAERTDSTTIGSGPTAPTGED